MRNIAAREITWTLCEVGSQRARTLTHILHGVVFVSQLDLEKKADYTLFGIYYLNIDGEF